MTSLNVDAKQRMQGIECEQLRKAYGDVQALDGVSLAVEPGEILALLGPNGSGKTTTVRILTTLSAPDSGSARVAGSDVVGEGQRVRETIGSTPQETKLDSYLTGEEHLGIIARMRHIPRLRRIQEVATLLTEFELDDVAQARIGTYSGGTRRRLDIATSLIGNPPVLFLDEPSTGLDPHSRERMWDAIRQRTREGTTVLLTTQYMEEADALADSVVVLARGRVIDSGPPAALKANMGGNVVELTLTNPALRNQAAVTLAALAMPPPPPPPPPPPDGRELVSFVLSRSSPPLLTILRSLDADGVEVAEVIVRRPTLDEVFLDLTRKVDLASAPETETV